MKRMNQTTSLLSVLALFGVVSSACAQSSCSASAAKGGNDGQTIVATAVAAGKFNTLAKALQAGDLVDALEGKGPFTVFAPTDEAFAKLPDGTLEDLLKPQNKGKLQDILKYHVVSGTLMAKDVLGRSGAETLNGQMIDFAVKDGKVTVDNALVVKTDIQCSNGVIHVIDAVILPASDNIVDTARKAEMFNTLLIAATKAGLAETLAGDGPLTVFAPTDEAFAKLPAGTLDNLLQPQNREQLANILKYHVVSGRIYSPAALNAGAAHTLLDRRVTIKATGETVYIGDAKLLKADLDASNGVIHVIDTVLLPN